MVVICQSHLSPPSSHPSLIFIFILTIQISTLANGQRRLDNKGLDKQTNTCLLQVNIGAKTQCLSKEIGVGVFIPCWQRSQLSLGSRVPDYSYHSYTIVRIVPTEVDLCIYQLLNEY